jgi:hypothetical protein
MFQIIKFDGRVKQFGIKVKVNGKKAFSQLVFENVNFNSYKMIIELDPSIWKPNDTVEISLCGKCSYITVLPFVIV